MKHSNPLLALLVITGAVSAQTATDPNVLPVPSDLTTVTRAGVFANGEVSSLPAGLSIVRPTALDAISHGAEAHLAVAPTLWPGLVADLPTVMGATFGWSGRAGGPVSPFDPASDLLLSVAGTTGTGHPQPSSQTFCLTLNGGPGILIVEFKGQRLNRAYASATVAIGDRALRLQATDDGIAKRVAVGLPGGAAGLQVRITLEGFAHGSSSAAGTVAPGAFDAALSVQFRPDDRPPFCTITPDQRGCPAGGELHGAIVSPLDPIIDPRRAHIALSLEGALAHAVGVTILNGSGELIPALPFSVCPLLVDPVVVGVFETDEHGNARTFLRAPPIPLPGDFRYFLQQVTVQFGGDVGLRVATSNTLAVKCWHPAIALTDADAVSTDVVK